MSLREQILAAADRPATPIEVPEWGVTVYLRPLSAADRIEIVGRITNGTVPFAVLVALGVFDADGSRVFTLEDLDALAEKRGEVIERLGRAVMRLNRMGEDDTKDAAKN